MDIYGGSEKMINKVKNTLKENLQSIYPKYNIYLEDKKSNEIVKPALRIKVVNKTTNNQRDIIKQNVRLEIIFTVDDDEKNKLYWDISDTLDLELKYLNIDGTLIRTGDKISEIVEGELHFKFQIQLEVTDNVEVKRLIKRIRIESN
jgi:hypothetical protein